MAGADGAIRPHYAKFERLLSQMPLDEFEQKRHAADLAFLRQGITFNVYGDAQGTERIFPFDLVPRIIPAKEWERIESGLVQRITALNLFLHDIYHEQNILKDGTIPPFYVLSGKHFRREFVKKPSMGFGPLACSSTSTKDLEMPFAICCRAIC